MINLIIKLNRNPLPNDCPLCDLPTNPNIGAELFLADTEAVVCLECGSKHAPILATLLTFGDMSRFFQTIGKPTIEDYLGFIELSKLFESAETIFGNGWTDEQNIRRIPMNSFGIQRAEVRNV